MAKAAEAKVDMFAGFTTVFSKMTEHEQAHRLVGIMDLLQRAARAHGNSWVDEPDNLRLAASNLGVPYLALWLVRDSGVENPSVTSTDVDELLNSPVAVRVVRHWFREEEEA